MGDLSAALVYGRKFEHALNYSVRRPLHSEKFTFDYLSAASQRGELRVLEMPFRFRRTRAKGAVHDRCPGSHTLLPCGAEYGHECMYTGTTQW